MRSFWCTLALSLAIFPRHVLSNSIRGTHSQQDGSRLLSSWDTLNCDIQANHTEECLAQGLIEHEYYYFYAMGLNGEIDSSEQARLESDFKQGIVDTLNYCYQQNTRRMISSKTLEHRRKLEVVQVSLTPNDVTTNYACPANLRNWNYYLNTKDCVVKKGTVIVEAHACDDSDSILNAVVYALARQMNIDHVFYVHKIQEISYLAFLGTNATVFDMRTAPPLFGNGGDGVPSQAPSLDPASSGNGSGQGGSGGSSGVATPSGAPSVDTFGANGAGQGGSGGSSGVATPSAAPSVDTFGANGGGQGGSGGVTAPSMAPSLVPVSGSSRGSEEVSDVPSFVPSMAPSMMPTSGQQSGSNNALVFLVALGIPVGVALIAAGCYARPPAVMMTMSQYEGKNAGNEWVLCGTGDPLGSFHEGLYHYMRDGTRYLSTRCVHCYETRRNGFYNENYLGTIPEDGVFEDEILGIGNASYASDVSRRARQKLGILGEKRGTTGTIGSAINVHKCSSAVCERCSPSGTNTTFVPSRPITSELSESYSEGDEYVPETEEEV